MAKDFWETVAMKNPTWKHNLPENEEFFHWFKPKQGKNTIRILPSWTNQDPFAKQFWLEVRNHWSVSSTTKTPIVCTETTPGVPGECPVCALINRVAKNTSSKYAQERCNQVRPSPSYYLNVIDRDDPTWLVRDTALFKYAHPNIPLPFRLGAAKVQAFSASPSVFKAIMAQQKNYPAPISDPLQGADVVFYRSGSGHTTRYKVAPFVRCSMAVHYDKLNNLENLISLLPLAQIRKILAASDLHKLANLGKL